MQSHYEINVSFYGKHFFATAPRSCRNKDEARKVFNALKAKFPESEGYEITCTNWQVSGEKVSFEDEFIPWSGGARPVAGEQLVEVKLRNGRVMKAHAAPLDWRNDGIAGDIIAYRVVSQF